MTSDNGKVSPTFSESWMEGVHDKISYNLSISQARKELNGLNEKQVRKLSLRLDDAIKIWIQEHGVPIVKSQNTHTRKGLADATKYRRAGSSQYRETDMIIILGNENHPPFNIIANHRQRIALLVLKAAENQDSENVLWGKSVLDMLRGADDQREALQTTMKFVKGWRKHKQKVLNDAHHEVNRKAKKFARKTYRKMLKSDGSFHDIKTKDIALAIQVFPIVNGYPEYALADPIWDKWIGPLDPPGRKPGRKPKESKANSDTIAPGSDN